MPFKIVQNDITRIGVDAIVNDANTSLQQGGGVCGAIFKEAGTWELQADCDKLAPIQMGEAVITPGFNLPAKYIIHTAGPAYRDGKHDEERLLRDCYLNSLKCAIQNDCESIAFPLISSEIYGYPKKDAFRIAVSAIEYFLKYYDVDVYLIVFDKESCNISENLSADIDSLFPKSGNLKADVIRFSLDNVKMEYEVKKEAEGNVSLEIPPLPKLDKSFSEKLLMIIDAKGKKDSEIYKKANIDRRHFAKIRGNANYMPSKKTAVALAVALELTLDETKVLLECAGLTLSRSQKFDVIVEHFISKGMYNVNKINESLFYYDQQLLGG
jgi:O-acetyl-ADP-ribose deacetylase (regulator of RNase III)